MVIAESTCTKHASRLARSTAGINDKVSAELDAHSSVRKSESPTRTRPWDDREYASVAQGRNLLVIKSVSEQVVEGRTMEAPTVTVWTADEVGFHWDRGSPC
ncbi:MAG: hypothetical protein NVSMB52_05700 [Chloroflexota bacterium]